MPTPMTFLASTPAVLQGAPGAEDAVVVAGVEQPVGDVGVGGDDRSHGIHARVGGVVVGQVDDVGIGEDAEFLELLGGVVGAQVADLEVLVFDGDGLDLGAGELVPAFLLVEVGDQLADLEAGGGGVKANEGGGLAAGVEDGVVDGDDRDAGLLGLLDDGGTDLGVGHDDDDAR